MAVARVLGAKGLDGALRIEVLTDRDDRLIPGARLFLEGEAEERTVAAMERGGRVPVLHLSGTTSRDAAEQLIGRYLEVEAEPLPAGALYWHQVVGMAVRDEAGRELGHVVEVFRAGENEVYRVEAAGQPDLLLPALRDVVREVDLEAGRMTVRYEAEEVR
ncbi:MAG TPA: ribosome maturation factor RimM [Candidatus Limnocylindria bacterium]|nr:ribosome maturation factor RimM [Candidatus Limnocylindria bacterium]